MRLLLLLGTLAAGIAIFFALLSGVGWEKIWLSLQTFSVQKAVVLFLLTGIFMLAGAVRWQKVLEGQGHKVRLWSLWKMYVGGFSLLFFIPVIPFANEVFRSSLLKEKYHVELKSGMASVVIDRILEITTNLCVVVLGGVIFLFAGHGLSFSAKMIAIVVFVSLWVVLVSFLYIRLFQSKSILGLFWKGNGHTKEVENEVFAFFSFKNQFFWQGLWLSLLRGIAGLARAWVLILFLGKGFAFLPGVTILGFYYLAVLVPIPAALGSHDALQAAGFSAFGLGSGTGAAFALIIRATEAVFAVAGLFLVLRFGFSLMKNLVIQRGKSLVKILSSKP